MIRRPPRSTRTDTLFPYTTLFRSTSSLECELTTVRDIQLLLFGPGALRSLASPGCPGRWAEFVHFPARRGWRRDDQQWLVRAARPRARDILGPVLRDARQCSLLSMRSTLPISYLIPSRSEERRVGQEGVSTGRS